MVGAPTATGSRPARCSARVAGRSRSILTGERTALNFLGHLSGIATADRAASSTRPRPAAPPGSGTPARPRPGLRSLEKAAVRAGGGAQPPGQPVGLDAAQGQPPRRRSASPRRCAAARDRWPGRTVHVECDSLDQVRRGARGRRRRHPARQHDARRGAACVAAAERHASGGRPPHPARGVGRHHARRPSAPTPATGVDMISVGGHHQLGARARHRPRHRPDADPDRRCVGATERPSVLRPTELARPGRPPERPSPRGPPCCSSSTPATPRPSSGSTSSTARTAVSRPSLLDHWRIATDAERTSDELRRACSQGFLGLRGLHARRHRRASRCRPACPASPSSLRAHGRALPRASSRWSSSPACAPASPILYENPKEVGADRIANAVGAYDLYGGPDDRRRLRHRHHLRRRLGQGRVPRRRHRPRHRDQHGRPRSAGPPRCGAVELVEPRSVLGQEHGRVDPVRRGLRLRRAGRRHVRPHRGRARRVHHRRHRRPGRADRPARRRRIEHEEPWLTLHGLRLVYEKNV